jgi:hypothetical protein
MNDLDSWIARLKAETAAAAVPGAPAAPNGAAPAAPTTTPIAGLLSHPLMLPAVVGLITYFASDKNWKWAAAAAGAAVVLKK